MTTTTDPEVKVRYFDFSPDLAMKSSLLLPKEEAHSLKLRTLSKLGIVPRQGETPLVAWLRAMAEENGLPVTRPAHPALANCITGAVGRFVFFLA